MAFCVLNCMRRIDASLVSPLWMIYLLHVADDWMPERCRRRRRQKNKNENDNMQ